MDALDARKAAALRGHLARCEGCRRYWDEISNVKKQLAAAPPDSNLQPSQVFHRRMTEKLRAVEFRSVLEKLAAWLHGAILDRRVAMPAAAALMIALLVLVAPWRHQAPKPPPPTAVQAMSASSSESDLAPTIVNYQLIAGQSLEKLDELVTEQGNKSLPPAPLYTASSFNLASGSFR